MVEKLWPPLLSAQASVVAVDESCPDPPDTTSCRVPYASLLSEAGLETGPLLLRPLRYLREPNVTVTLRGRPTGALLDMLPSFCDLLFTTLTVSLFFLVEEWPKTSVISSPKASVM